MRSAKENKSFPYQSNTICYFEVSGHGEVSQIGRDFNSIAAAYRNAASQRTRIFAVWPGEWSSDLFIIDDLNAFADAFGVPRPDDHRHSITWKLNPMDNGKSSYAYVDICFECGCELGRNNIKKFACDMEEQKGWDVATSTGISGHSGSYTIRVKRSSLGRLPE